MANPIRIRVLTNEGLAVEDDAVAVRAPGGLGSLGVLRNHAPLVTTLAPGKFTWRKDSGERRTILVGDGLMEVVKNRVTLLTSRVSELSTAAQD